MAKRNRRKGGRAKLGTSVQVAPRQERMARGTEPPPGMVERQARAQVAHALRAAVTLSSESNFYTGFTEDISQGGVFVETEELHPVGTPLQLEFSLPDSEEPIQVIGEVRWIRALMDTSEHARGVGVAFTELPDEARQRIEAFLSQRDALFYD